MFVVWSLLRLLCAIVAGVIGRFWSWVFDAIAVVVVRCWLLFVGGCLLLVMVLLAVVSCCVVYVVRCVLCVVRCVSRVAC